MYYPELPNYPELPSEIIRFRKLHTNEIIFEKVVKIRIKRIILVCHKPQKVTKFRLKRSIETKSSSRNLVDLVDFR